ncbi:hypothetical protein ACIBO5_34595 [Nonomuraea angiospora]
MLIFTVTLLHLGYPPEVTLLLVAGAAGVAIKAASRLVSRREA